MLEAAPMRIAQSPQLAPGTSLEPGIVLERLWIGRGNAPLEVVEVSAAVDLRDPDLRRCWHRRLGGRGNLLLLFQEWEGTVAICGPDGDRPHVARLAPPTAELLLNETLRLGPGEAAAAYLAFLSRTTGSGGVPGLRNQYFLTTHYLTAALRRNEPQRWERWLAAARTVRGNMGPQLLRGLGFTVEPTTADSFRLSAGGRVTAVAHQYPPSQNLDRIVRLAGPANEGVQPAAAVLSEARAAGARYAFLLAGPLLRLHPTRPEEEFEEGAATAAFLELDLRLLPDEFLPVLWGCCSAEALGPEGHLPTLLGEACRYAVGLRERFRDRVYSEVVPRLVGGLWQACSALTPPIRDPGVLYRATLVLLFRMLFVLYAEDRNFLPLRHHAYRERSITHRLGEVLLTHRRGPQAFDIQQTDIWEDLCRTFGAIRSGHREWGVPPYDGGLFEDAPSPEARLLARVKLPNPVVGQALYDLAIDQQGDERGKVDFGDLGVRHLGTIYEGLLSYRALVAETDLTVDTAQPSQPYKAAGPGDPVAVKAGTPYLASPEGGRKASGSYYTPAFVVDRLVDGALRPILLAHMSALDAIPDAEAAARLFDVKVCDPAMGSGHFLTRALDYMAEELQGYLARRPLAPLTQELERARAQIGLVGRDYGAPDLMEGTSDFDLLRRIVLKRCMYGVDLNPMAVELARLSLWLRSFVPGLPLSYLGHTLRCGNSLVGVVGPEVTVGLSRDFPLIKSRLDGILAEAQAKGLALGSVGDLELHEVEGSKELQERMERASDPARLLFDSYTAQCFEPIGDVNELLGALVPEADGAPTRLPLRAAEAVDLVRTESVPLHWALAFPEVFLRGNPGFDAVVGNPPWEEVTVEDVGFFVRYLPGLKSERSADRRSEMVADFIGAHPAVAAEHQAARAAAGRLRDYLRARYELTRSGDPDLYRAFCERFLQILHPDGSLGVVLPRTAFSGDGTAPFRERLLQPGTRTRLDFLLNSAGWVFPDAEPRYTLALALRTSSATTQEAQLSCSAPARDRRGFDGLDRERIDWSLEELRRSSPGLEVPLFPNARAADIYRRLTAVHPRFGDEGGGFKVVPWTELHATKDRKSGLIRESGPGWPVYTGESFDLWQPETRPPGEVVPSEDGLAELQRKRQRSAVWRAYFPAEARANPDTLPQHHCRILFRDVTNRTNSRTVIACLVPPRLFASNKAPSLLFPSGDWSDQVYVLGLMCSIPFDWLARRRVETNVNFFILNSLPLPRLPRDSVLRQGIVATAGRLACPDERFAEVAQAIDVPCGSPDADERAGLVARLDALAAHAYGLSEDELVLMFEDFPNTEAGLPYSRREAIVRFFRN